ncbi:MAG TPA: glycosyltransferase family 87 protein [Candidatus Dormibacteraeota bacterium]|nr:glycosyltransferase family 87 protein [Candidatus Dormibacteraeota bacterium]
MPTNWNDLAQYYAASRLWLRGQNFAKPENFVALWRDEVGSTLGADTVRTHIAPPPGAVVLLAPIGALSWPAAKIAWLVILLGGFAAAVWSLAKTVGFRVDEPRMIAFAAGCLALAPFHTGIASANQTILLVGLCGLGIWAASIRHDVVAGLLFGAACSMKPHIGAFLVLYYLIHRRWRLFVTSVAFTVALVLLAAAWMQVHGVTWVPDYLNNIRFGAARNKIDDFTAANPIRFMLINLQVPFYSFTHDAKSANALALSMGAVLIAIWIVLALRSRAENGELLPLATVAVIGLLPLYHRLYDASVLAIPLCWCLSGASGDLKKIARAALLLMAPFLVPGTALLQQAVRHDRIPDSWTHAWWWDRLVMPHQTWLLLMLSLVLLYGMMLQTRSGGTGKSASATPAL